MRQVQYFAPVNADLSNPEPEALRQLLLEEGSDYWNSGAGQGWIKFQRADGSLSELLVTFYEPLGFNLEFVDTDQERYVSLGAGDWEPAVHVYVGGNPVRMSPRFFIPRRAAAEAVEWFAKTGLRSNAVEWGHDSELGWDYFVG